MHYRVHVHEFRIIGFTWIRDCMSQGYYMSGMIGHRVMVHRNLEFIAI
jgi:hypothetical protein